MSPASINAKHGNDLTLEGSSIPRPPFWKVHLSRKHSLETTSHTSWTYVPQRPGNRTHGFVRRNIKTKIPKVRETAYNTLVRPQLEYASAVWDPHNKGRISQIEQVQRRAARWTVNNFERQASETRIVQALGWRTLDQRRADARLCLFYKIVHGLVAVPLPEYIHSYWILTGFRHLCRPLSSL